MAVTAITPVDMALDTPSADLPVASMTSIATGSDGASIDLSAFQGRPVLIKLESSGTSLFTIVAGVKPPSMRQGLGDLVLAAFSAADEKYLVLEPGRFLDGAGSLLIKSDDNDGSIAVIVLPRAW